MDILNCITNSSFSAHGIGGMSPPFHELYFCLFHITSITTARLPQNLSYHSQTSTEPLLQQPDFHRTSPTTAILPQNLSYNSQTSTEPLLQQPNFHRTSPTTAELPQNLSYNSQTSTEPLLQQPNWNEPYKYNELPSNKLRERSHFLLHSTRIQINGNMMLVFLMHCLDFSWMLTVSRRLTTWTIDMRLIQNQMGRKEWNCVKRWASYRVFMTHPRQSLDLSALRMRESDSLKVTW